MLERSRSIVVGLVVAVDYSMPVLVEMLQLGKHSFSRFERMLSQVLMKAPGGCVLIAYNRGYVSHTSVHSDCVEGKAQAEMFLCCYGSICHTFYWALSLKHIYLNILDDQVLPFSQQLYNEYALTYTRHCSTDINLIENLWDLLVQ